MQPMGVSEHRTRLNRRRHGDGDAFLSGGRRAGVHGVLDDRGDVVDGGEAHRQPPHGDRGGVHQVVGQALLDLRDALDELQGAVLLRFGQLILQEQRRPAEDRRNRSAKLMRDEREHTFGILRRDATRRDDDLVPPRGAPHPG